MPQVMRRRAPRRAKPRPKRGGLLWRLRTYFVAGLLVSAPVGITFWLVWAIVTWIDKQVTPLLPGVWNPNNYLPFAIPGLGVLVSLLVITLIGALTAGIVGRMFVRVYESMLARMPVVRGVYAFVKQVFEMVFKDQTGSFRQVVMFEYPRRGSWALGFITGVTEGEVQHQTEDTMVNVFLPTTPNPTSGYLLFVPQGELIYLDMSVEDGIKMVVSGGMVTPEDTRPQEERDDPMVPHQGTLAGGAPRRLDPWDRPTVAPAEREAFLDELTGEAAADGSEDKKP